MFLFIFICFFLNRYLFAHEKQTAVIFKNLITNKQLSLLRLFLYKMPKGGDIHHHYSGALYAETYLSIAQSLDYQINTHSFYLQQPATKDTIPINKLLKNTFLFRKTLASWSILNYPLYSNSSSDSHFFNTFLYFDFLSKDLAGLKELKKQALLENICYLESQIDSISVESPSPSFNSQLKNTSHPQKRNQLFEQYFHELSHHTKFNSEILKRINRIQSISSDINDDEFTLRFQVHAYRCLDLNQVFSQLYCAFVMSNSTPLVVGVNLVGPENHSTALTDYHLHMEMIAFFKEKYPAISVSLHAGELSLGLVTPENLTFHINEALSIALADRIGHGTDIAYEENSIELLKQLKSSNTAVEICFKSSQFILGIQGKNHPYLIYQQAKVPIVIGTDDPGVLRHNLTEEYFILSNNYSVSYLQIKEYVYNSITYSFLHETDKKRLLKKLDQDFLQFEKEMLSFFLSTDKTNLF